MRGRKTAGLRDVFDFGCCYIRKLCICLHWHCTKTYVSSQLDTAGIRPLASAKRLQKEAYKAWFAGLTFNAIAGFYTLWQLRHKEQSFDKSDGEGVVESKKLARYSEKCSHLVARLTHTCRERTATNMQLISDLCDLTIPISALGYLDLDDGIVGLAGTASSLIGVWTTWKKTA